MRHRHKRFHFEATLQRGGDIAVFFPGGDPVEDDTYIVLYGFGRIPVSVSVHRAVYEHPHFDTDKVLALATDWAQKIVGSGLPPIRWED